MHSKNCDQLALFGSLKQIVSNLDFFVDLQDGIERYCDDILFWEKILIQFHKISKIPRLGHQDHNDRI
jgi:hypothetical protein